MTESPRLPVMPSNNEGKMGLEQNIFDQPAFADVRSLVHVYRSEEAVYAATSMISVELASTLSRLMGYEAGAPIEVIAKELTGDSKLFLQAVDELVDNMPFIGRLGRKWKNMGITLYGGDTIASVLSNLEDPVPQVLYVNEHRYMYKGDGAPIGNRFNAITAPLTYPNWYDNRILTSERPPDPYYGLQEHLTHLGYGAFAFIPTNSDRSLNHYVKGATPLI